MLGTAPDEARQPARGGDRRKARPRLPGSDELEHVLSRLHALEEIRLSDDSKIRSSSHDHHYGGLCGLRCRRFVTFTINGKEKQSPWPEACC